MRARVLVSASLALIIGAAVSSTSWSADGAGSRLLAFTRGGALYVVHEDGTGLRRLTRSGGSVWGFDWSPDGRSIVLAQSRARRIVVIDVKTGRERAITRRHFDDSPNWSPDGRWIAFSRGQDPDTSDEIWIVRPTGKGARLVTRAWESYTPSWSPNSRKIVFDVNNDTFSAVALVGLDGTGRRIVGGLNDLTSQPTFSPDGRSIAFVREWFPPGGSHTSRIYSMTSDAQDQRPLIVDPTGDIEEDDPSWSPDGKRIAFLAWAPGTARIDVVDPDGTNRTTLAASTKTGFSQLIWSPDGGEIAYVSTDPLDQHVYVMNADGSDARRLTTGSARESAPAWQP